MSERRLLEKPDADLLNSKCIIGTLDSKQCCSLCLTEKGHMAY